MLERHGSTPAAFSELGVRGAGAQRSGKQHDSVAGSCSDHMVAMPGKFVGVGSGWDADNGVGEGRDGTCVVNRRSRIESGDEVT